jgi:hypothetical protein
MTPYAEGCALILEDKASGGSRDRPKLAQALKVVGQGDTLLVVRIDRLARSLSHLLEIVETLCAKSVYFRSAEHIDGTTKPFANFIWPFARLQSLLQDRLNQPIEMARFRVRSSINLNNQACTMNRRIGS